VTSRRSSIAMLLIAAAVVIAALVAKPDAASAHPLAPSLLELRQTADGRFAVRWKTSAYRASGAHVAPQLPAWCSPVGGETAQDSPTFLDRRFVLDCGARGLQGATIGVSDLDATSTLALLRVELADGRVIRALLDGSRPAFAIPERESRRDVALGFVKLGVTHLLTGLEHLLFLLCLCLLVRERRALLWTLLAFTAGHSVTLTLSTLGLLRAPEPLAEAGIALSIVLVAAELLREDAAEPDARVSWLRRRPLAMAFGFGLLHGLGFSAALATLGLPAGELPLALLAFNLGIEIGQLAFVVALLALARLARPLLAMLPARSVRVPAYAIGALGAFWFWSQASSLLGVLLPS
jgi:hydrogenase/urease accessory protein HupE